MGPASPAVVLQFWPDPLPKNIPFPGKISESGADKHAKNWIARQTNFLNLIADFFVGLVEDRLADDPLVTSPPLNKPIPRTAADPVSFWPHGHTGGLVKLKGKNGDGSLNVTTLLPNFEGGDRAVGLEKGVLRNWPAFPGNPGHEGIPSLVFDLSLRSCQPTRLIGKSYLNLDRTLPDPQGPWLCPKIRFVVTTQEGMLASLWRNRLRHP